MKDKRVGVAVDFSPGSRAALKWAVENVVRKGDHLILVVVRPKENYEQEEMQICAEFSDPTIMKMYRVTPDAETINIANTAGLKVVIREMYGGDRQVWLEESERGGGGIITLAQKCSSKGNRCQRNISIKLKMVESKSQMLLLPS
ncbi:unnamed protein product [Malus baccata var. baccata]